MVHELTWHGEGQNIHVGWLHALLISRSSIGIVIAWNADALSLPTCRKAPFCYHQCFPTCISCLPVYKTICILHFRVNKKLLIITFIILGVLWYSIHTFFSLIILNFLIQISLSHHSWKHLRLNSNIKILVCTLGAPKMFFL